MIHVKNYVVERYILLRNNYDNIIYHIFAFIIQRDWQKEDVALCISNNVETPFATRMTIKSRKTL